MTPTVAVDLERAENAQARAEAAKVGRVVESNGHRYAVVTREWWEARKRGRPTSKARRAIGGALSTVKTTLGIDRVSDEVFNARLAVCASCELCIHKDGKPHTCGPMLEERKEQGKKTCGCVLRNKARDAKQDCPNGWWPKGNT